MTSTTYYRVALLLPPLALLAAIGAPDLDGHWIQSIGGYALIIGGIPYILLYAWFYAWSKNKDEERLKRVVDWLPFINLIPITILVLGTGVTYNTITPHSLALKEIGMLLVLVAFFAVVVGYLFLFAIMLGHKLLVTHAAKP
ncbi:MAG: hypothetical protein H6953_15055 [Chromatiaceae bacterium]|nr:hypothetical protein [Chromatiaceae bacterium]MCP5421737.1 hypothetical protein [Chromatiaceae bacterium]